MQKNYIDIGNKRVHNGQYMLTAYYLEGNEGASLLDIASEVAAESSTGSVRTTTSFAQSMNAIVYDIDEEQNIAYIAFPWAIFDTGGNIQSILTFVAGNVFGLGQLKACKLLDVWFPTQMLTQYDGPSVTMDDMRNYLGVYDRPIMGTIVQPKTGLTPSEYAEMCYDFWIGGGDYVKNDEPQGNQYFSPYEQMVDGVRSAMDKVESETGKKKIHAFNVSTADFDTMIKRADYVKKVMKPGSYAFLIDGITAGWSALQTLRRRYPEVFIHFHRAGHGAYTRVENAFGYSVPVLTKFARLAGASAIHCGTAGLGTMSGNMSEDGTAVQQGLRLKAQGQFFEQVWSKVSESDANISVKIKEEEQVWSSGPRYVSNMRKNVIQHGSYTQLLDDWRAVRPLVPIASGGLTPLLLSEFLETVGTIDLMVFAGGVYSHPKGTKAGIVAMLQAYEAWDKGIDLHKFAENHEELGIAVKFFEQDGLSSDTQVQRSEEQTAATVVNNPAGEEVGIEELIDMLKSE